MKTSRELFQTGMLCAAALAMGMLGDTKAHAQPGAVTWVQRYNGSGNGEDYPYDVTVGGDGKVFVTGSSIGSGSGRDYATIAYSSAGVPLWTNRYNGPGNGTDEARAVAVDGSGNVIVTGWSLGSGTTSQYATIKYSNAGVPLWTNRYGGRFDGVGYGPSIPYDVAVDSNDNIFVTGYSWNSWTWHDYDTIKYSSTGVLLWTNLYNGPENNSDFARAVVVDGNDNVVVTGYSYDSANGSDYATIAYSNAGVPLWTNRYSGPVRDYDLAYAIAVDGSGNVVVTGSSDVRSGYVEPTNYDYLTIAYSGAGVPLWTNRYNGPGNGPDTAIALALDGGGNMFVTGYSTGSGSGYDFATIAYSNAGVPLWTNRYNGPGNGSDYPGAVAVDGSGNVFVTGYSLGSGSGYDLATIAYSNAGVPLWTNRYNGPANGADTMSTVTWLAVAPDGVIVAGGSDGDPGAGVNIDYVVAKYSTVILPSITAAEKLGNDLRLSFNSQAGSHYNIQARANLTAGDWINVVTNIPSGGAMTQTTVTNALLEPQQFYRIQQSP